MGTEKGGARKVTKGPPDYTKKGEKFALDILNTLGLKKYKKLLKIGWK